MNLQKTENKIIIRLDGGNVTEDFIEELKNEKVESVKASGFLRLEHPHCAFFKSIHSAGEKEFSRTTLYTPEGRLHIDREIGKENEPLNDKYVKKQEQLDVLLFYIRDLEVKSAVNEVSEGIKLVEMPYTPMVEFLSFVERGFFMSVISEYEIMAKHILSRLRRIYNAKVEVLASKLKGKAEYAVFYDMPDIEINQDLLERWHSYYVRKARLLK